MYIYILLCVLGSIVLVTTFPQGTANGFPTIPEINAWFQSLQEQLVSNTEFRFEMKIIGQSFEQRDIVAYCLGLCSDENAKKVPAALFNSMHHSREPEGMAVVMVYMEDLVAKLADHDLATEVLIGTRALW